MVDTMDSATQSDATYNVLQKIAGFQAVIPQFDNISAITPKFFVENVDTITSLAKCSPEEKLLVLKSRIRGDALYSVINSPDLSQEKNYVEFKRKFLAFFDTKISLATRQQLFSNCKMLLNEPVKIYAARVAMATQRFFNCPDLTNAAVNKIFEQSKLSKFLDGLLPNYKHAALMKDPQTFQEAIDFVELLQTNENSLSNENTEIYKNPSVGTINASSQQTLNDEIKQLINSNAAKTHAIVNALTQDIQDLKLTTSQNKVPLNSGTVNDRNKAPRFNAYNNRGFRSQNTMRQVPLCNFCGRSNHTFETCFYNPNNRREYHPQRNNSRGRGGSFPSSHYRATNRDRFSRNDQSRHLN